MILEDGFVQLWDSAPAALLLFARISGLFVAAPLLGGNYVPLPIKALISLAVTVLLAPVVLPSLPAGSVASLSYVVALASELGVGLILGFIVDCFFQAVRFGGDLIGRTAGFAAAESFNPMADTITGPTGDLFYIPMVLVFLGMNGHHQMLLAMTYSFDLVPVGEMTVSPAATAATVAVTDQVFKLGLALSFPVLAVILAITVAEGVIARAVPQINILHISFATKIMGTMIVLLMGVPMAVAFLGTVVVMAQEALVDFVPLLGGG